MIEARIVSIAAVAALLAACQHAPDLAGGAPTGLGSLSGADHRLKLSDDGANAKLATSSASAAPELMLECDHGSNEVHLTRRGGGGRSRRLMLTSGVARSQLGVSTAAFEGNRWVFAQTSTRDPALMAFRRTGRLDVRDDARVFSATADPNLRLFFTACEQAA